MLKGTCHCKQVSWVYPKSLESVTACNCTLCRRYGALWAYGYIEEGISISGDCGIYTRGREINGFHFCSNCGCLVYYLARQKDSEGLRIAVNLRMVEESKAILSLPVDHFDGLETFDDEPKDSRTVKDLWY
jgi:hypothetical protein